MPEARRAVRGPSSPTPETPASAQEPVRQSGARGPAFADTTDRGVLKGCG